MAGIKGRQVIFEWGGDVIPGAREKSAALNGERIDVTSDEDNGWRTLMDDGAAENQVDLGINGVTKSTILRRDWFAGDRIKTGTLEYPDGGIISGEFHLVSYSEGMPYNGAVTFESTFQSSGVVTYTPPTAT